MNIEQKSDILFGGRLVAVTFNDGSVTEVKVRQLPLADYEKAFALLADEIALTALICGQEKAWLIGEAPSSIRHSQSSAIEDGGSRMENGVSPESYEALQLAAREVNAAGFFAWSRRRSQREQDAQAHMMQALATLPPEAIEQITRLGLATTSPTSSPKRR